jgi:hypothetical protein
MIEAMSSQVTIFQGGYHGEGPIKEAGKDSK